MTMLLLLLTGRFEDTADAGGEMRYFSHLEVKSKAWKFQRLKYLTKKMVIIIRHL